LGSSTNIRDKGATCLFCSLILQSVKDSSTLDDADCYLNWEVDGREAARSGVKPRIRRIPLRWKGKNLKGGTLEDSYLVFMAPERYFRPTSDAQHVWENEALLRRRNIGSYGGNQALIKSWLDLCFESHHGPCRVNLDPGRGVWFHDPGILLRRH
jgi:hypothetical protein